MRQSLQTVLNEARQLEPTALPSLIGELEEIKAVAMARLTAPAHQNQPDELLDVPTAAARLSVSPDYLYRNHKRFPFTRRIGKRLLFSSNGLDSYLKKSR